MALRIVSFNTVTGNRIARVPGSFTYDQAVNEYGSIKVNGSWNREALDLKLWQRSHAKRTLLAVLDGTRVVCAGPITDRTPTAQGYTLNAAGSIWRILEDRLALNPLLRTTFVDGEVVIDEENPAPQWFSRFTGSYRDIAAKLVSLALAWGPLPIVTPELEGGPYDKTYNGWEMHTVASRLQLLTQIINGPELRFRPELREDGGIRFMLEAENELVDRLHRWNTTLPQVRVSVLGIPEDAALLASDVWAFGGKSEDIVLAARAQTTALTSIGYPVMQMALTGHTSVSELATLQGHVRERAARGSTTPEVYELLVHRSHDPHPGDHANITFDHAVYGKQDVPLKLLTVSGGPGEWLTVKGRVRHGSGV